MVDKEDCYVGFNLFNNKNVKIPPDIRSIGGQIPAPPPYFFYLRIVCMDTELKRGK